MHTIQYSTASPVDPRDVQNIIHNNGGRITDNDGTEFLPVQNGNGNSWFVCFLCDDQGQLDAILKQVINLLGNHFQGLT